METKHEYKADPNSGCVIDIKTATVIIKGVHDPYLSQLADLLNSTYNQGLADGIEYGATIILKAIKNEISNRV